MPLYFRLVRLLSFAPVMVWAGVDQNGRGAQSIAMANAFVAIADNPWAVCYNPAGLAQLSQFTAAAFFVPEQFGLSELQTQSIAAALPTALGHFGATVEQFGFSLYKETNVSIGYARKIDWGVLAGVTMNWQHLSVERYGSSQFVTFDLGLLVEADPTLRFGFAFKNVTATKLGSAGEQLPQILLLGTRYTPLVDLQLTAEIEKDIRFPALIKAGIEQRFIDVVALRLGVSNNPDRFSFGLAARYASIEFGYAGYTHAQLGLTHQIEINFELGE